jgi:thiamine pyrophosphokinase
VDALIGAAAVHVVRSSRTLRGTVGETITLLPLHGAAEGVRTTGLEYPLAGETLKAGSSRGVSNVFAEEEATVALERGVLLVVRPDGEGR